MKKYKNYILTVVIVIVAIIIYTVLTKNGILNSVLFPSIPKIMESFIKELPKLFENLGSSLKLLIPGVGGATILGITLGMIIGTNKVLNTALKPIIFALNPIPSSMMTPYFIAVLPTFYFSSVAVIFIGCFWPVLNGTLNGLNLVEQKYLDYADIIELKGLKKVFKVLLPASTPSILAGIKTSLNMSFILLAIAEMFATSSGLGFFIQYNADFSNYSNVLAGLLFTSTFIVIVMYIFERIRRKILFWTINENG